MKEGRGSAEQSQQQGTRSPHALAHNLLRPDTLTRQQHMAGEGPSVCPPPHAARSTSRICLRVNRQVSLQVK